jgi:hypothetical protein
MSLTCLPPLHPPKKKKLKISIPVGRKIENIRRKYVKNKKRKADRKMERIG